MDHSWLFENEVDNQDPESDDEESQRELESRLYAIIHHNDLSQPLPPELAKHYSVDHADDGELEVTLKHSLDDLKNEEICDLTNLETSENPLDSGKSNEVHLIPSDESVTFPVNGKDNVTDEVGREKRPSLKHARFSGVNFDDHASEKQLDSPFKNFNFFQHSKKFEQGWLKKESSKLVVPSSLDFSDWKDSANSNFISINECKFEKTILDKMIQALISCNPGVETAKLTKFASLMYRRNLKELRKRTKIRFSNSKPSNNQMQLNVSSKNTLDLTQELNLLRNKLDDEIQEAKTNISKKRKKNMTGSISLNISPFRPEPQVVDLVSDEDDQIEHNTISTSTPKLDIHKNKHQLPLKWSRDMALFYTKPNKRKMNMDADSIIQHLKRSTKASDWKVDSRDEMGFYQKSSKNKRKCANCNERGHRAQECPRPLKCCFLCGGANHMSYSCPYKICLKCGLYLPQSYGGDECHDCYFINLSGDTACEICASFFHRTVNCTDLWRSYHSTTEGEKNIPTHVKKNPRKFCCNCGKERHFSEDCPFPHNSGQQTSSFVTNYSCNVEELGMAEISFTRNYSDILTCPQADLFLQDLSNITSAGIMFSESEQGLVFQIKGTFEQCQKVKTELETFVNVNKRKWQGPPQSRKRQRVS